MMGRIVQLTAKSVQPHLDVRRANLVIISKLMELVEHVAAFMLNALVVATNQLVHHAQVATFPSSHIPHVLLHLAQRVMFRLRLILLLHVILALKTAKHVEQT
jgi:hypothetical protein